MKILHTADWHLGKSLANFQRIDEQREVLEEICQIADQENPDAILIAGDLFDSANPSNEAIELLYRTVSKLGKQGKRAVIAIAGNHDSPDKIEVPDVFARELGIVFVGYPDSKPSTFTLPTGLGVLKSEPGFVELSLPQCSAPLRVLLTPYANEVRLKRFLGNADAEQALRDLLKDKWAQLAELYCDEKGVNILIAHLFMAQDGTEPMKEPEDERPILRVGGAQIVHTSCIPERIQYTALGHLHRYHHLGGAKGNVVYSGSLLEYSFSEAHQQKFVLMLNAEPNQEVEINPIPLHSGKRLHRKRFAHVQEAVQWLEQNPHAFVEITMVCDNYLPSDVQKQLFASHNGIVAIIPELTKHGQENMQTQLADPSKNIDELFKGFYFQRTKQEPSPEILGLFTELLSDEE